VGTYIDPDFEYPYLGNGSQLMRFSRAFRAFTPCACAVVRVRVRLGG
jgi:hypothetical protein